MELSPSFEGRNMQTLRPHAANGNNLVLPTVTNFTGRGPFAVAFTPDGKTAYVVNYVSNSISVIDVASNTETQTVSGYTTSGGPMNVAFTPDGKTAYVANRAGDSLSVIDVASHSQTGIVSGSNLVGLSPNCVAFTPNGKTAYVTYPDRVAVIDVASNAANGSVNNFTGSSPFGVAFTPDGKTAYVANYSKNGVSVINVEPSASHEANTQIATISGAPTIGGFQHVAFTRDGKIAYVTTSTLHAKTVLIVDVAKNQPIGSVSGLPDGTSDNVAFTPDGKTAYVTYSDTSMVSVIDVASATQTDAISPQPNVSPYDVAITPDGTTAYITYTEANSVSVVRLRDAGA
jgi:YVTN family beta-propeller protein